MRLNEFIEVPANATTSAAPILAAHADAFRQNDLFFEKIIQSIFASPLVPNGADGAVINPSPIRFVQATTLVSNNPAVLESSVPLVWFARERITIREVINARGKGAAPANTFAVPSVAAQNGDFGGSGGGSGGVGGVSGQGCFLPVSNIPMVAGGGAGAVGNPLAEEWATRAVSFLGLCRGGASGGGGTRAGAGGGIVVLCAPIIELAANGKIDARGADATDFNSGGGGGGMVLMIARQILGIQEDTPGLPAGHVPAPNVLVAGGAGHGTGGAGGRGFFLKLNFF